MFYYNLIKGLIMNMTFEEIGRELGVTGETVRKSYQSGMRKLKQYPELLDYLNEISICDVDQFHNC